jgi:hypothetical protein
MMVCQTLANELSAAVGNGGLLRELDLSSIEDGLIPHDCHLRLIVAERLHPEQKLVEDNPHAPNINLLQITKPQS